MEFYTVKKNISALKILIQFNHESLPRFPKTWERFLNHTWPEQTLYLESVVFFPILSALALSFFCCCAFDRSSLRSLRSLSNLDHELWNGKGICFRPGREVNVFDISKPHYWPWNEKGEEVKFKIREILQKIAKRLVQRHKKERKSLNW